MKKADELMHVSKIEKRSKEESVRIYEKENQRNCNDLK